jgi:hypothetical protein
MEHERGAFKVNCEPLLGAVKNWRKRVHLRPNRALTRMLDCQKFVPQI